MIHYIFILELPPSKITSGFRAVFALGLFLLSMMTLFGLLTVTSYDNDLEIHLPLQIILKKIAAAIPPLIIAVIPLWLVSVSVCWKFVRVFMGHGQIGRFIAIVLFKIATPWCHRVTFPLFFIADVLTSLGGTLVDLVAVLSLNTAPHAVYFVVSCIPTIIRAV